ncbi:methionine adenosyltransferase [candidate division WOR-3 bacterium]|nr:methionine adenosyltransferase [candidate division WOR-3 bacterium]
MSVTRFTSESVTEGHPDKVCDRISDAVLDRVLLGDPEGRVACETYVTVGMVLVGGEITTKVWVDLQDVVRGVLQDIGYLRQEDGISAGACAVLDAIGRQSPDIAQGVDAGGAGDQGVMYGYACRETDVLMPLPIVLAHDLARRLAAVRHEGVLSWLRPDGKSQVTVVYEDGVPRHIDNVVIAAQHDESILDRSGLRITRAARERIIAEVIRPVIPAGLVDRRTRFFVNETGKFVVGGPQSDTGMTGRKIIVDTYGGWLRHGGGAFSGKDPTKVDRSATYMARYIAKNCVAAGVCDRMEVRLAYCIGRAEPTEVSVDTFGTARVDESRLERAIRELFPLAPREIIRHLGLRAPVYAPTAAYGHFGRKPGSVRFGKRSFKTFTWERTDMAAAVRQALR